MKSYFFVPANRLHKIDEIKQLNIDQIIIDLEDAVKSSERNLYLESLANEKIDRSFFVRVPLYTISNQLDLNFYKELKSLGYNNFVFPKIQNIIDFEKIIQEVNETEEIILLIETPLFFVQLKEVVEKYHQKIKGIGLGSHDLMNFLNAEHSLMNIEFYRNFVLLYAKAFQIEAFDIASMELENEKVLEVEILDGFKKGFDAKLYIHPWQIKIKDNIEFFSENDLDWAKKIYSEYLKVGNAEEFNPIVVDGEIIEKPHLNKVFTILKYFNKNETK
ncbi:aldolase/citrate lyase family protein [Empedobacter brevis]